MTVHGAKGLEAPVVILADTMTPPAGPRPPRLLQLAGGAKNGAVIWVGRKADDVPSVAEARAGASAEAEHEYRRLLYVAMTRAADRLIVCGADGIRKRPENCWYDLMRDALEPRLVAEGDGDDKVLRYRKPATGDLFRSAPRLPRRPQRGSARISRRGCGNRRPPKRRVPRRCRRRRLSTKRFCDRAKRAAPRPTGKRRCERGRLVHRLMQALPDIPAERRKDAAERYLANAAADFVPAERAAMAQQVLAILDDEELCRDLCAGKPRRGADRRPHCARGSRPDCGRRAGGSPRRHGRYGPDRRLQDRPDRSGPARRGRSPTSPSSRSIARCWPACSRAKPCARRCFSPTGRSSWKCPPRPWTSLDAALTKL